VSEKDQQNRARDDVLRTLLRTPPQPKTAGKSTKRPSDKTPNQSLSVKPFDLKQKSCATFESKSSKPQDD
jgi:hypothetical protein